ncbi:MAG: HEAT repeat domain-containing protein [Chloroflexi bacterium]|nr:HEAT repeat domain-containing protein [Chloroflexota bacterium]
MDTDDLLNGLPDGAAGDHESVWDRAAAYLFEIRELVIDERIVKLQDESLNAHEPVEDGPETSGAEDTATPLETLLCGSKDPRERMKAAWRLGKIQTMVALRSLITALREGDESAQVFAAIILVDMGRSVANALIAELNNPDIEVRRKVIWVLWMIGDRRAVKPLINSLRRDEDIKVRAYSAWALGRLNDSRAIPPLVDALDDPSPKVRWDAAIALAKFGERAIELLVEALYDPRPQVRVGAANALGWIMDTRAITALTDALKDRDREVRQRAAFALGWIKDRRAVEPLIETLGDEDDQVRMQAAAALGWIRDKRAIEPLARLIEDESEWTRYTALEALSDLEAVAALNAALKHPNSRVQEVASHALRRLKR